MLENLHKGFHNKYEENVAKAQSVQKDEDEKRKALIEDLQNRIRVVQDNYEVAGKQKIEKFRDNETYD